MAIVAVALPNHLIRQAIAIVENIALERNNMEMLKLLISYDSVSDNLVLSAVITRKLEFLTSLKV